MSIDIPIERLFDSDYLLGTTTYERIKFWNKIIRKEKYVFNFSYLLSSNWHWGDSSPLTFVILHIRFQTGKIRNTAVDARGAFLTFESIQHTMCHSDPTFTLIGQDLRCRVIF